MGDDVASTRTTVVNKVVQLAGGITFITCGSSNNFFDQKMLLDASK